MYNFWQNLPKPFFILAPMENVTDFVFREIIAQEAKPDVIFTEFTSADGLFSKGRNQTIHKLKYSPIQRPIVAQIWGNNPQKMYSAAKLVQDLKFDGIDINMGCPDRGIIRKGAGAGLIGNYKLTKEIIEAVKKGAPNLPLSIKTRIGLDTVITEEWIGYLLRQKIHALTVHGRTAKQMSKGKANWKEVHRTTWIKDKISPNTVLIGNGDITSYEQATKIYDTYSVDGIMIGRGIFANPWIFAPHDNSKARSRQQYVELLLRHLKLQEETWGSTKHFDVMKKFFKMYINNFKGANLLRQKLMETTNSTQVEKILLTNLDLS